MRILVVEDDHKLGSLLEEGLGAEASPSPGSAMADRARRALAEQFDLVLLDYMLPGMSGHEVTVQLRAAGRRTPILMLTARDAPEDLPSGPRGRRQRSHGQAIPLRGTGRSDQCPGLGPGGPLLR
jgi:DNA-binding response OmpR family regulator